MKILMLTTALIVFGCISEEPKNDRGSSGLLELNCMGGKGTYYVSKCIYRNYGMVCTDSEGSKIHCRDYQLKNNKRR